MSDYISKIKNDGFRMPGEFEPHDGCLMIWPVRPGSWPHGAKEAQAVFGQIARAIAKSEKVWMLTHPSDQAYVQEVFADEPAIEVLPIPTDDAWARDVGPTCVVSESGEVRGIDWQFNAWGGLVDGLYAHWEQDDAAAAKVCKTLALPCYDAKHFVLEGGSIHSDGEGTVIVTESCLLSPGRNPSMSKEEIEEELKVYLGAEKIIWLPYGIYQDETNEHVDNVCAFVKPGEVVLAWTDKEDDPQWEMSHKDLEVLERERDARGRKIRVHKLPIPDCPVCVSADELDGYVFEDGEDMREEGERLAASYVNFYISNGAILLPQFGDVRDGDAVTILGDLFPEREIIPIMARPIIVGGGNIHCITQQIPKRAD